MCISSSVINARSVLPVNRSSSNSFAAFQLVYHGGEPGVDSSAPPISMMSLICLRLSVTAIGVYKTVTHVCPLRGFHRGTVLSVTV
jgi:hypothetical protein